MRTVAAAAAAVLLAGNGLQREKRAPLRSASARCLRHRSGTGAGVPLGGSDEIAIPVEIVAGAADDNVPVASSAEYFAAHIPGAKLVLLHGGVQHHQFLAPCTAAGRQSLPLLCTDRPGVNRDAVHKNVAGMAVEFFDHQLKPPQ